MLDKYQKHLEDLHYPEYAHSHARPKKLSAGRSLLDLSSWRDTIHPDMVNAVRQSILSVSHYQMAQNPELLEEISRRFGYPQDSLHIVAGADDALRIAAQYCIGKGDKVLIPVPSFGRYEYHAQINQGDVSFVYFSGYPFAHDVEAIAHEAKKRKAECIFIASPNSPTGCTISLPGIEYILSSTKAAVIFDESLIMDPANAIPARLIDKYPNLFVCGSFSKLYSLAGARIGYLVSARDHVKALQKLISPFQVNSLSIELAKFALSKDDWVRFKAHQIHEGLGVLRSLSHPSLRVTPSEAPVALLECTKNSHKLYTTLQRSGIVTVSGVNFRGLENTNTVRIIIRNKRDATLLLRRLKGLL